MGIKKILLYSKGNQTTKFRTKNWIEVNDEPQGTYNKDNEKRFNLKFQG